MAFPSKEEVQSGDFEVDEENFKADMEEKIEHIVELIGAIAQKNANQAPKGH